MSKIFNTPYLSLGLAAGILAAGVAMAAPYPDMSELPKHQTPVPYAGDRYWHVTHNLGPTGARGVMEGRWGDTLDSREILIRSVEPGSPADGVLRMHDVIVGAATPPNTPPWEWTQEPAVKPFESDARTAMGRAITWAESTAGGGKLKLLRHRDGETEAVTIELPVMGDYAADVPLNCPKSQRLVTDAASFLAENMPAQGY
ncbi:MAG: DUF6288 domain-containing protein, partial [Phycisphaeraceae bacterium]|nr:DUF6288 domain-containing protein [Phycisphaeraceae bacterium]